MGALLTRINALQRGFGFFRFQNTQKRREAAGRCAPKKRRSAAAGRKSSAANPWRKTHVS